MNDFKIYTDGSCWDKDGLGGAAAIIYCEHTQEYYGKILAENFSKVSRMEFKALLMALSLCFQLRGYTTEKNTRVTNVVPIEIEWFSDREDLVYSVDQKNTGYKRNANPDLWAGYAYYEPKIKMTAHHNPRNKILFQKMADELAGDMRALLKKYTETSRAFKLKP
jgi:ribonuclease HI